jgi:crossover junction endonuclease MUS81
MKLVIDNREPKELKTLIQDKIENIELKNLEIGDIIFLDDDDNIVLIFERKSISDLISSIKDGRYSEQSFRLQEYPLHNHNIFYLIEGSPKDSLFCDVFIKLFKRFLSLTYIRSCRDC